MSKKRRHQTRQDRYSNFDQNNVIDIDPDSIEDITFTAYEDLDDSGGSDPPPSDPNPDPNATTTDDIDESIEDFIKSFGDEETKGGTHMENSSFENLFETLQEDDNYEKDQVKILIKKLVREGVLTQNDLSDIRWQVAADEKEAKKLRKKAEREAKRASREGMPTWGKVLIVVGSVVLVVAAGATAWYFIKKAKEEKELESYYGETELNNLCDDFARSMFG